MRLFFLKILLGVILILTGEYIGGSLKPELVGGGIILIITTIALDLGGFMANNWQRSIQIIRLKYLALKNAKVRFSMSYQYRIKVNDKYLLVKNSNKDWAWFQHVGGKYKRLPETNKILADFEASDDMKMATNNLKKDDLAVFVPAKNAIAFLDWFNSFKDREISHWREFYEELLGGKEEQLLSHNNFKYVNYKFVKSVITPLKKAPIESGWNCWEILQYDVLDLLPTTDQLIELQDLLKKGDKENVKWASEALINRLGYDDQEKKTKYRIGAHTKWVINLKWSNN